MFGWFGKKTPAPAPAQSPLEKALSVLAKYEEAPEKDRELFYVEMDRVKQKFDNRFFSFAEFCERPYEERDEYAISLLDYAKGRIVYLEDHLPSLSGSDKAYLFILIDSNLLFWNYLNILTKDDIAAKQELTNRLLKIWHRGSRTC